LKLTPLVKLAVPPLYISSLPQSAIGFSFEGGRAGLVTGGVVLGASAAFGAILFRSFGLAGVLLSLWLLGTTGAVMAYTGLRGLAFVKPLCSGCKLLPLIKEHEGMHLAGLENDSSVWKLAKQEHAGLRAELIGDPAICSFCPIPKRLNEH